MKTSIRKIPLFAMLALGLAPAILLAQGIEIPAGGSMVCTGAATIEINNGSFVNNGTYTKGSETFTMSGTTNPRSISGTALSDFYNLSITNSGGVSIAYDAKVTVSHTLSNTVGVEGLILKSTAAGTASLIESTAGISATVERYLADYVTIPDYRFHLLSSPVAAQPIQPEFVGNAPIPLYTDFYAFDEPTNMWINTRAAGNVWNTSFESNFTVGKGYLVAYPDVVTKNFKGTLNTYSAPLVLNCTYTAGQGNGWNLLGNPFPSAIDWEAVALGDGMDNALYYYDNDAQNYRYYLQLPGESGALGSGQRYIPAMQGFMVHAKSSGTKTVSIDNNDRTHSGQDVFYKSANTLPGSFSLKVEGNGFDDETFIHFNQAATTAFDGSFDAYKLKSYSDLVPKIYTAGSDNTELAINGLPEPDALTVIPLFFETTTGGSFTLSANLQSLQHQQVILEDVTLHQLQDLSVNPVYSFTAAAGDDAGRFALHFSVLGVDEDSADLSSWFYAFGKSIYIQMKDNSFADVYVRNLTGQVVKQLAMHDSNASFDLSDLPFGVYVVSVVCDNVVSSGKVVLR